MHFSQHHFEAENEQNSYGEAAVLIYLNDKWHTWNHIKPLKQRTVPKTLNSIRTSSRIIWHLPNEYEGKESSAETSQMQRHGCQKPGSCPSKTTLLRPPGHTKLQNNCPGWNITCMLHAFQYLSYSSYFHTSLWSLTHTIIINEI